MVNYCTNSETLVTSDRDLILPEVKWEDGDKEVVDGQPERDLPCDFLSPYFLQNP